MGKRFALVGAGALVVGVLASTAGAGSATIVPGVSLAGISIGDKPAAVREAVGAPMTRRVGPTGSGVVRWEYPSHNNLVVTFERWLVTSVLVSAVKGDEIADHTAGGFGLLTPTATVARAYRRNCGWESGFLPLCRWTTATTEMTFRATGDYGAGRDAPIQAIQLERSR